MNGAELLIKAAAASGVEYCFANPGTTEIPLVAAMAAEPAKKARLPHPTTTTDYGDLLSDSDEGSLSIDSGGM